MSASFLLHSQWASMVHFERKFSGYNGSQMCLKWETTTLLSSGDRDCRVSVVVSSIMSSMVLLVRHCRLSLYTLVK